MTLERLVESFRGVCLLLRRGTSFNIIALLSLLLGRADEDISAFLLGLFDCGRGTNLGSEDAHSLLLRLRSATKCLGQEVKLLLGLREERGKDPAAAIRRRVDR